MSEPISYTLEGRVATITMDDGKVNSISLDKLAALRQALDRAESEQAVVVLTGRDQRFSAGFDLKAIMQGGELATRLVQEGFQLIERILTFPTPVVIACNGHAMAMGCFILLSADVRIGAAGPFKIGANEVAIGMTLPYAAIELCRMRLSPTHVLRASACAEIYSPEQALAAGFLDRVVPADELRGAAQETAKGLTQLNMAAYRATKQRLRAADLETLHRGLELDKSTWRITS